MVGNSVILIALIALAAVNAAVSIAIIRSGYYERRQLIAQVAIIWLIPMMGAVLVGIFLRVQRETSTFDTRAFPERSEKALLTDLGGPSHLHDHDFGH